MHGAGGQGLLLGGRVEPHQDPGGYRGPRPVHLEAVAPAVDANVERTLELAKVLVEGTAEIRKARVVHGFEVEPAGGGWPGNLTSFLLRTRIFSR